MEFGNSLLKLILLHRELVYTVLRGINRAAVK